MSFWSYRIIRHPDPNGYYALHEVFFHEETGDVHSWTERPIEFVCGLDEGPDGLIASLERALKDARERSIFDLAHNTPGEDKDARK